MTLAGVHELAARFSVDRSTVRYWRSREGFPEPLARLKAGPVWDLEAVATWRAANIRNASQDTDGSGK
jgi:hypothetical protein